MKCKSQLESGELKGWFSARESEEQRRPLRENKPAAMYEHAHRPVQYHSSYSEEVPGGGKISGKIGAQLGQEEERNARCYR